jgi:hypothetical protein
MALPEGRSERPVTMSSAELGTHLAQIQGYFAIEFRLLLEQLSQLAARSVVLAGPMAADRLQALKGVGFGGLGRIAPIRMDRVLTLFLFVLGAGFLIFYALRFPTIREQLRLDLVDELARGKVERNTLVTFMTMSLVIAIATVIGAVAGSDRGHARAASTPWHTYGLIGLLAALMFFLVHGARLTFFADQIGEARQIRMKAYQERVAREAKSTGPTTAVSTRPPVLDRTPLEQLRRLIPFSVLPFLTAIAICRLARMPGWPAPRRIRADRWRSSMWERAWDGAAIALVFFIAYLLSRSVRELIGWQPPPWFQSRGLINWQFLGPQMVLGFAIGAVVIGEVRTAAHVHIVETRGRPDEPAPAMGTTAARPVAG